MPMFDSIVVGEEWISEHFLTADATSGTFAAEVRSLRGGWDEQETAGHSTSRSGLREHATAIARALATLGEADEPDPVATRDLHALVLRALRLDRDPVTWAAHRSGAEVEIPNSVVHPSATGPALLVLQAYPAVTVEDVLDTDPAGAGRLLDPALIDGKPSAITARVVSTLFLTDNPPPFVLVLAGRWALLAERVRWPEGRWLAIDLGLVAERRQVRAGGELDTVAALLGPDLLLPDAEGAARWHRVLAASIQHTVGVSKDLREGIRLSVEIIANEVVTRRRAAALPIAASDGAPPELARDLTRQSLRFLYRILFLLYAEASPELDVLPVKAPEYAAGYGMDRLRDLTPVVLVSERSRRGTHFYDSLHTLFRLIDVGHTDVDDEGLHFNPLRADLFASAATALIDEVGLGNEAVQTVLRMLLQTKEKRGSDAGYISYSQLGINQLGAVYEGLMSYSGFIAEESLVEVAKNDEPEKGTWIVPTARASEFADYVVKEPDPVTGQPKPVIHDVGTFVYRLAGRERQQSASYYTPESLTRSVVKHSLAELLDQDGRTATAAEILELTVCEPALGSGAFAIEAVRQLADVYLTRRERELGTAIPPEDRPRELQKVKAHIALHQVYGVDLNATAVELAEVSLWLDTMHAGLKAPWFGLHLRRGNSLIGARRAVYAPAALDKKSWLATAPDDVPLSSSCGVGPGIHHFLLPASGWGAAADSAEARTYAPEPRERLRAWRSTILKSPNTGHRSRLAALARRIETLWDFARRRLEIAESQIRRDVGVWGREPSRSSGLVVTREEIEAFLTDEHGAYRRLRRVMDAWCALWYWPLTQSHVEPPTWESWLAGLEAILGIQPKETSADRAGQANLVDAYDWAALGDAESFDLSVSGALDLCVAVEAHPWLAFAANIADREGFFHWELDFAPVFASGGFNLQVGNPPWVRVQWDEVVSLGELDPYFAIAGPDEELSSRREKLLSESTSADRIAADLTLIAARSAFLKGDDSFGTLSGLTPNLYRSFMIHSWKVSHPNGIVGLLHPETYLSDARAGRLRRAVYERLRRLWIFQNQEKLFEEIGNTRTYGIHVYSCPRTPISYQQASYLFLPETLDRSLVHDGSGPPPTLKTTDGKWNNAPHADRIVDVDERLLATFAELLDRPETPPGEARMLYTVNRSMATTLEALTKLPRFVSVEVQETPGWRQPQDVENGLTVRRPSVPATWSQVILQGPYLDICNPLFQQPNPTARNHRDYSPIDLESAGPDFVPRSTFLISDPANIAAYPAWDGRSSNEYVRLIWRRRVDPVTARTLQVGLIPPGPTHVEQMQSLHAADGLDMVVACGLWSSVPVDFWVKVAGIADIRRPAYSRFPHIRGHVLEPRLTLRVMRLNCLVRPYAEFWADTHDSRWQADEWAPLDAPWHDRAPLGIYSPAWTEQVPLRRAADRRQALVEIDAIAAVMLGLSADQLVGIYRAQFAAFIKEHESLALFDRFGRHVPNPLARDWRRRASPAEVINGPDRNFVPPFHGVDREKDLWIAHDHFSRLAADLAV
ncbi:MAG: DNA methyltransferase [Sporichthyaceae bacterium]